MNVKECMTKDVKLGKPDMRIKEAAKLMRDGNFGVLPISNNEKLVGMLTDRDIVIRCIADGRDVNETLVSDIMTENVLYCYENQPIDEVLDNLGNNQIWRMPVVNEEKRLVGILSLCDLSESSLDVDLLEQTIKRLSSRNKKGEIFEKNIEYFGQHLN